MVSIAGPISNLLLAFIGILLWALLISSSLLDVSGPTISEIINNFLNMFVTINIALFVFNLLPFPPLDGYRVVEDLAPASVRAKLTQYENYGSIIFLILVITPLDQYTIRPIFNSVIPAVGEGLSTIVSLLLNIF